MRAQEGPTIPLSARRAAVALVVTGLMSAFPVGITPVEAGRLLLMSRPRA